MKSKSGSGNLVKIDSPATLEGKSLNLQIN